MAVKLGPGTQSCFSRRDILLFSREYQVGKWPLFLQVAPSGTDPPPYQWTDVESVKALSSWRDISGVRDPALRVGVGKGRQAPVLLVWKDLCNTGCGNETGQQPLLGWNCRPRLGVGGRGSPISWPPLTRAELLLLWSRGRARAGCNQDVRGAHCSYRVSSRFPWMTISLFKISRDEWLFSKIIIYNFHQSISFFTGQRAPHPHHYSGSSTSDCIIIILKIVKDSLFPTKIKSMFLGLIFSVLYNLAPYFITISVTEQVWCSLNISCVVHSVKIFISFHIITHIYILHYININIPFCVPG